ncbi:MAG TPA: UDP-N-acetylmuramoyl-L-alanine--D-glutamate ligase [Solirubrobacteraceae bacterium]|nr:UDP-N-acetylmuramoyl-L-alanine--D-glutamate ligase [Solirubrobacteraceae bacterium]
MARRPPLPPGPFLIVGLARSGLAAGRALRALGERVSGCDSGPADVAALAELAAAGIAVHASTDGVDLLDGIATVVKSPGVPQEAPVVRAARERGLPVLGELELGWRLLPNELIAITGSNGKTTTTELVGRIHREAGLPVAVAGNVGTALSSLAGSLDPGAVVVCEASSFQLEDTLAFAPEAAVLLNLAPDHLDRHGTFDAYRDAKLRIFANQDSDALAVVPEGLDHGGAARRVAFASPLGARATGSVPPDAAGAIETAAVAGEPDVRIRDRRLAWRGETVIAVDEIRLRGAHNLENAMAAAAVTLARGVDPAAVRAALAGFAGVAHRLEEVARIDGVLYVDDSKATNVASAVVGIRSFPGGVHAILGGRGKWEDYAPLAAAVTERCTAAYLIGEEAARLRAALEPTGVPVRDCGDLEHAMRAARAAARPGEVVLLSPACASYDQYRSFEERGRHFKALAGA